MHILLQYSHGGDNNSSSWLYGSLVHFSAQAQKKNHSKKSLPFSQKKYFLKFRENATLIFQKAELSSPKNKIFQDKICQTINNKQNLRWKISCISGNATLK